MAYPLDLPDDIIADSISMRPVTVVGQSTKIFTLETKEYDWGGTRWEMEISLPRLSKARANLWKAWLLKLRGKKGSFLAGHPLHTKASVGTVIVNGAGQTGTSLSVSGITPSLTGAFSPNDWIQLGTGENSRLYTVVDSADSNLSGVATLQIQPALRSSPVNGSAVEYINPRGVFKLASNDVGWEDSYPDLTTFSIPCVEVI